MTELHREEGSTSYSTNRLMVVGLALLLALGAFFSGLQLGSGKESGSPLEANLFSFFLQSSQPDSEADLGEFWRVWNVLESKFVSSTSTDQLSREARVSGAIRGLVASYDDPYTVYLEKADAEQFEDNISGNFSGVGMEVGMRDGLITIIAPLPDSPAEKSGILAGDVLVKIDGTTTDGMTIDDAVKLIRGEKGTDVVLTIYREGDLEFREITVTRDIITIPTLDTEIKGDVMVIKLYSFNALAEAKVKSALEEFQQGKYKKLVLDLRGNPGGFLQSAVGISSFFLPTGKVVVRESFGEDTEEEVYRSQGKIIVELDKDHFVILTDGGSASASEILAGALSEHGIATTIGQKTFGKGSVQELVTLPGGASLKVTVARWLTPNGISFSHGGLAPDVKITRTPQQVMEGTDTQMDAALEWLSGNHDIGEVELVDGIENSDR